MRFLPLFLVFLASSALAQIRLIPQAPVVQPERGEFSIRPGLRIWSSAACTTEREVLQAYWQQAGLPHLTSAAKARQADILLTVDTARREALGPEGYELHISGRRITLTGGSPAGVFYGLQTLRQVLPATDNRQIPALLVRDKPRFGWRSFTLDERTYRAGTERIKTLLDQLARHKFNRFHLLLNPGTAPAEPTGGEYPPAQLEELIRYAQERHILAVVERTKPKANLSGETSRVYQLATGGTVRFWQGSARGLVEAARAGQQLIHASRAETELSQPLTTLPVERVYRFDPVPDQMPAELQPQILGVDYSYIHPGPASHPFEDLQPRLAAAAEVAWTFLQTKDWGKFRQALPRFTAPKRP
ncbi:hypothetical protein F5984_08940 [Rudanella paleaurantiibacter]|uniref:beta-N-acetylhexosaminidase n=1 Tax=Rudanella paleaurantiibacter TaxID=2614655 RepID=A0A7J5TZV5_9BACT|nr:beta-N-acetylhexosaminidase [Rudanella paleaurantiibacter]KAB7730947.1 hypothetical protein F5984_08940 [Rudanella paleaurantiibacter]